MNTPPPPVVVNIPNTRKKKDKKNLWEIPWYFPITPGIVYS